MAVPVTQYPTVRTVTQLVRSLLPDEPIGLGFSFTPLSAAADGSGNVTLLFQTPPGFIATDNLNLNGFSPSTWNGVYTVTAASGTQIQFKNAGVASTSPTTIGQVQGYGTGRNFTDTKLMPVVNSAYRSLQRALKMAGSTELKVASAFVTIPAINTPDPSALVTLGYSGLVITSDVSPPPSWLDIPVPTGALPSDVLRPLEVWERQTGNTSEEFIEMSDMTEGGGLPSQPQGYRLAMWEWVGDGINFIGALQDEDVRIRYQRALPSLSDGGSSILILDSHEYVAYQTASLVESGRGGKNSQEFAQRAEDAKDKLVAAETRAQQSVSRRPRPFSSRNGPRVWRF